MEEYGEMKLVYHSSTDLLVWTRLWSHSEGTPYLVKMTLELGVRLVFSYTLDGANARIFGVSVHGASLFPIASSALNGIVSDLLLDGLSQTVAVLTGDDYNEPTVVEMFGEFPTSILPVNIDAIPAGLAQPM